MSDFTVSLPTFTEVRFTTKDGENIRATKQNDMVTIVGDKNGMRQLPLSEFKKYMIENAGNFNLASQPVKDEFIKQSLAEQKYIEAGKNAEKFLIPFYVSMFNPALGTMMWLNNAKTDVQNNKQQK